MLRSLRRSRLLWRFVKCPCKFLLVVVTAAEAIVGAVVVIWLYSIVLWKCVCVCVGVCACVCECVCACVCVCPFFFFFFFISASKAEYGTAAPMHLTTHTARGKREYRRETLTGVSAHVPLEQRGPVKLFRTHRARPPRALARSADRSAVWRRRENRVGGKHSLWRNWTRC